MTAPVEKTPTRTALLVPVVIAFLSMVPPTIIALATLNATHQTARKADIIEGKAETLITETAKIHVLTNTAKTQADNALAMANETIKRLELLNAVLVGATRATPAAPAPVPQAAPIPPAVVP